MKSSITIVWRYSLASRIFFFLLAIFSHIFVGLSYDTSGELVIFRDLDKQEMSENAYQFESLLARTILVPFLRWDTIYFEHIAREGYLYEQEYAFFPLLPVIMRLRQVFVPFIGSAVVGNMIVGLLFCQLCAFLCPIVLHALTLTMTRGNEAIALVSAIIFCIGPGNAFLSAIYTESPFALFSFLGLFCLQRGGDRRLFVSVAAVLASSVCFAIATGFRSNGILLAGFLGYSFMHFEVWKLWSFPNKIGRFLVMLLVYFTAMAISIGPMLKYLWDAERRFCLGSVRPWCPDSNPRDQLFVYLFEVFGRGKNIYAFVQREYWNVGFLRYFEWKQTPNFVIASPILLISLIAIVSYFFKIRSQAYDRDRWFSCFSQKLLFPHMILWSFCLLYGFFVMHVQVVVRFFTFLCPFYWFLASLIVDDKSKSGWTRHLVIGYCLIHSIINVVLFSNFYPPA